MNGYFISAAGLQKPANVFRAVTYPQNATEVNFWVVIADGEFRDEVEIEPGGLNWRELISDYPPNFLGTYWKMNLVRVTIVSGAAYAYCPGNGRYIPNSQPLEEITVCNVVPTWQAGNTITDYDVGSFVVYIFG